MLPKGSMQEYFTLVNKIVCTHLNSDTPFGILFILQSAKKHKKFLRQVYKDSFISGVSLIFEKTSLNSFSNFGEILVYILKNNKEEI